MHQLHQKQLNQSQLEMESLRKLNNALNEQLTHCSQKHQEVPVDNSQRTTQTLIEGFRTINIEIKPLKFDDSQIPKFFLEKWEKFFKMKQIPD